MPTRMLPMAPVIALLLGLFMAGPASAHRLLVFAGAVGDRIEGSAYFAGGQPARGARVLVLDADGTVLAVLKPDDDGRFAYRATAPALHRIVAEGADGHRAEWRIEASALAAAFADTATEDSAAGGADADASNRQAPGMDAPELSPMAATGKADSGGTELSRLAPPPVDPVADPLAHPVTDATLVAGLPPELVAAIEAAVARQVRPLREELAAAQAATRLRDVLGGLGYIVGLAGLGLWWTRRRGRAG